MKVAIDSGPLSGGHSVRGVGVSIKGLIESLLKYNADRNIKIDPVNFSASDLTSYDILHYTAFNPFFLNYPRIGNIKCKNVLTIHDLIPLIYKNHYPPGLKGAVKFQVNKFLAKKADAIITVSETSKKDIIRLMNIDQQKINVIFWAADEIFRNGVKNSDLSEIRKLYKLPEKYILYVGDVNYNKNLSTLIEACDLVGIPLVIVGKQASNVDDLISSWKNLSGPRDLYRSLLGKTHPELLHFNNLLSLMQKSNVITTGYVPLKDLVGIYNLATVYCQPSYYEGFGIPILEAFSSGVPVVISKTQALVEIAGGAALIADPYSAKDFAEKISSLLKDSTQKLHLVRAGRTRVKDFSWEETVKETIGVYRKVMGNK